MKNVRYLFNNLNNEIKEEEREYSECLAISQTLGSFAIIFIVSLVSIIIADKIQDLLTLAKLLIFCFSLCILGSLFLTYRALFLDRRIRNLRIRKDQQEVKTIK